MTTINKLSALDAIAAGDQLAVYDNSNGDARRSSITLLQTFMQDNLTFSTATDYTTQRSSPSATGFTVLITDGADSIHLILTPIATFATGTITLPAVANAVDKQELLLNCTQIVTTLTVGGNGATVTGAPTTLATANEFFRLKYDLQNTTWYRVG